MVASRWTTHPTVRVPCPVCGVDLPPVMVDADARADVDPRSRSGRVLHVDLTVQELDAPWWDEARRTHPDCIPPTGGDGERVAA